MSLIGEMFLVALMIAFFMGMIIIAIIHTLEMGESIEDSSLDAKQHR